MTTQPAISIIIPSLGTSSFITRAIASASSATRKASIEIVVVDAGPSDETTGLVRALACADSRIRIITSDDNRGPAAARNLGIAHSSGAMISFLDASECYGPHALDRLSCALDSDRELDVAMGRIRTLGPGPSSVDSAGFRPLGEPFRAYRLGTALFNRTIVEKVGPLDESLQFADDVDYFLKLQELRAKFQLLDDVVLHTHQYTGLKAEKPATQDLTEMSMVLRSSMRRRRELSSALGVGLGEFYYVRPDRSPLACA